MCPALSPELAAVRDLALEAGAMLLDHLGRVATVEQKTATEFVTDVDRRVEDLLLAGLGRRFPGETLVAEESGNHAAGGDRTWFIDPLDGTTNYAHGYPFFAVSLACRDAAGLRYGVVYAPYLDELYLAEAGDRAVLERPDHGRREVLPHRTEVPLERALLATGFPYVRDITVDRNTGLVRDFLKARCHGVRRGGSAAIDLCHVAAGRLDGYWEWHLRPWDTAAGALIARQASAVVTDAAGGAVPIPTGHILAAAPGLHAAMIEILAAAVVAAGGNGNEESDER